MEAAALRFFRTWRNEWKVSEAGRHPVESSLAGRQRSYNLRELLATCLVGFRGSGSRWVGAVGGRAIEMGQGRAICPSWIVSDNVLADETAAIDNALQPAHRQRVHAARAELLRLVDSAARSYPDDEWIAGQRVRFWLDQGDERAAARAASDCRAASWWCGMLKAQVLARTGAVASADSAFAVAQSLMPRTEKCIWNDHASLIDSAGQRAYRGLSCAERDSINNAVWWLADGLYSVPGNDRRVEQFRRMVDVRLRWSLLRDERFEWTAGEGGGARTELALRYGNPTYHYWPGISYDITSACSCRPSGARDIVNDLRATYEYSRDAVHAIPAWTAVVNPTAAAADDWEVTDPALDRGRGDAFKGEGHRRIPGFRQRPADAAIIRTMTWWPGEHAQLGYALRQLPEGQVAAFRRDTAALLAVAVELDSSDVGQRRVTDLRGVLLAGHSESGMRVVEERRFRNGASRVLRGMTSALPSIVSVEIPPDGSRFAARTRFGLTPPPPLRAMAAGEIAISAPIIVAPNGSGATRTLDVHEVIDRMFPNHRVSRTQRIGVYWESYGVLPSDTVDVSVWIERYTEQGIARRLGIALNVTGDLNTPVVVSWQEPSHARSMYSLPGAVPVIGREVALDVSGLPAGEYWLEVAMSRAGGVPVRARRGFVIE